MNHSDLVINSLIQLGEEIRLYGSGTLDEANKESYVAAIRKAQQENPWFLPEFTAAALKNIGKMLQPEDLSRWTGLKGSTSMSSGSVKTIGLVMAGNLPLVGFHDFISVLVSGHRAQCKLSSDDAVLLPFLAERMVRFYPKLKDYFVFQEDHLKGFDAVIATGSNNTARYFEYYFGKVPHIIRKSRNGVGVLDGTENETVLKNFASDIFLYFGLGCRSISKLFVPEEYNFEPLIEAFDAFGFVGNHNKYCNNYDYYRSIFLINKVKHYDNGFAMLTESSDTASPPSVVYYERYADLALLNSKLDGLKDQIQCVVSASAGIEGALPPGTAQEPKLWDYADGVDTLQFLRNL